MPPGEDARERERRDRQLDADAALNDAFVAAAGSDDSAARSRGDYGYAQNAKLMRDKPPGDRTRGLPADEDALASYARRVNRPGQIQSFGVVLLVASEASAARCAATAGTILAASTNCAEVLGVPCDELLDGNVFEEGSTPFAAKSLPGLTRALGSGAYPSHWSPYDRVRAANAVS